MSQSKVNEWLKRITMMKQKQKETEELFLKLEGQMEFVEKKSQPNSIEQALALILHLIVREARINRSDIVFLFETFLTLLSEQQKELGMLKDIVISIASERTELSKKIEKMEKWRKEREPILQHLRNYLKESGEFLDRHK